MKVRLLFFAALREQMRQSEAEFEVASGVTVSELALQLFGSDRALLFAVNHDYVTRDYPIKAGDEIAFVPPVAGG